jgi:hypothetical protein
MLSLGFGTRLPSTRWQHSTRTPNPLPVVGVGKMKTVLLASETMDIPEEVVVTVEGPRGKLTRNFKHLNLDFQLHAHGSAPAAPWPPPSPTSGTSSPTATQPIEIRNFLGEKKVHPPSIPLLAFSSSAIRLYLFVLITCQLSNCYWAPPTFQKHSEDSSGNKTLLCGCIL